MTKVIDYYHFLLSPWSYLGIKHFNSIAAKHNAVVNYKPIAVMDTFDNMGSTHPSKRHPSRMKHRMVELKRWSKHLGIQMNFEPAFWPADQTLAAQMVYAIQDSDGNAGPFSDAILTAVWAQDRNIADETVLAEIARECGFDSNTLIAQAKSDAMAQIYTKTTKEAHERDVFGSPTYIYNGENFWGQDRIDFLDKALSE
ncbi:2-hydroxychromene-2-carboxylate isomerase [Kiloniella sp. EL199]|uniref:2-hydroxychromene-2-carboxylate isomerase n=1 Tax=Kiloniella sp. EL199 TaxID=2107581 RepID=UPI000EA398E4|nr:2-hydroxychromene-2-carboxylate isomerase [Kiloniella sp. EL199]